MADRIWSIGLILVVVVAVFAGYYVKMAPISVVKEVETPKLSARMQEHCEKVAWHSTRSMIKSALKGGIMPSAWYEKQWYSETLAECEKRNGSN